MCSNTDESQKHYVKWHKPYPKDYILIPFIWSSRIGEANLRWKKIRPVPACEGGWRGDRLMRSRREPFRMMVTFYIMKGVVYTFVRTLWMVHSRFVHFIMCKSHPKQKEPLTNVELRDEVYWCQHLIFEML